MRCASLAPRAAVDVFIYFILFYFISERLFARENIA